MLLERTCTRRSRPRGRGRALRSAALCAALSAALCGAAAHSASAALVEPASLSMTSEAGDYIGQGGAYHYSAPADTFDAGGPGPAMRMAVSGGGDAWSVRLAAPDGQRLAPGVYAGATRYPFQAAGVPGLSVSGNGRGCNTVTGSFEVYEAIYAADGTITRFSASFTQHCEGFAPALLGSIEFGEAPPPPPPLAIAISLDSTGSVNPPFATVGGTVTCNRASAVTISGTLDQWHLLLGTSRGSFVRTAECSPNGTSWRATLKATSGPWFGPGSAKLVVQATGEGVTQGQSATIALKH